jgi:uncharacterized protein (DUF58 family)
VAPRFDEAEVARVAQGLSLALPRTPHRGRVGEHLAGSAGSSLEIHDFRHYQPGDDVRQLDWNAVARTGELILRTRREEVAPRVEVVLDASASMALSEAKAARACEVALLFCTLAARDGLEPTLTVVDETGSRARGHGCAPALRASAFAARDPLPEGLSRSPPLRPCGMRVVVSDFLFEAAFAPFAERLARGAAALAFIQLLDPEDASPAGGFGARLVDAESAEALEQVLTPDVVEGYLQRLAAHQGLVRAAASRVRARWVSGLTSAPLVELARTALSPLWGVP